jgi:hypothetical protein
MTELSPDEVYFVTLSAIAILALIGLFLWNESKEPRR